MTKDSQQKLEKIAEYKKITQDSSERSWKRFFEDHNDKIKDFDPRGGE